MRGAEGGVFAFDVRRSKDHSEVLSLLSWPTTIRDNAGSLSYFSCPVSSLRNYFYFVIVQLFSARRMGVIIHSRRTG